MTAQQLTNGTKIITSNGDQHIVMSVYDNMVKVYGNQGYVHISKVNRIVK